MSIVLIAAAAIPPPSLNLFADVREMLRYDFMRYALLTGSVTAIVAGLVGYFVVLQGLAFASDALGDFAFPAALGALLLGVDLHVGLIGITVLVAAVIGLLGERVRGRDVAVGTVYAWVLGLGVLFLTLYSATRRGRNGSAGVSILFGSILGLNRGQAILAALVGGAVIVVLLLTVRPLLLASLLPDVAAARGVPVRALNVVFLVLVAVTVANAVPAVGSLLVFALLVTPAAVAQRLTARPAVGLTLSAAIALMFVWVGLFIGFYTPYPVSFLITAVAFVTYVASVVARPMRMWRHVTPVSSESHPMT